ncbi:hypothetical protein Moror_13295 [Moniliophthora roreri MCA 2997]|uniref:Uncharacterized protein n=1 Tax=Moniliophthora roreri (strain MCA 2997) TaxID=1381753 RepID=V2WVT6_MONRO|nr:hypothetical protein Moror_13295 [Moniliophthora roreri MCA 2997]KAI3608977.1 hypothetical protein WG66_010948 [Moniliophthora roreri]
MSGGDDCCTLLFCCCSCFQICGQSSGNCGWFLRLFQHCGCNCAKGKSKEDELYEQQVYEEMNRDRELFLQPRESPQMQMSEKKDGEIRSSSGHGHGHSRAGSGPLQQPQARDSSLPPSLRPGYTSSSPPTAGSALHSQTQTQTQTQGEIPFNIRDKSNIL